MKERKYSQSSVSMGSVYYVLHLRLVEFTGKELADTEDYGD